ncbi:Origin specific replication binding factor [Klebsiella pneumoniae subsp. rhinoscleromatis]|nr:Origin specific replication binding factor [Klebsiella pneumoniae subsp. rhinoscleromatis]
MSNVFAAIQNRDAGALARMMGPDNHQAQQDNVVNISAERLVDALFKQLKQLFPAAEQTNLKTAQQETDAKRQWIVTKRCKTDPPQRLKTDPGVNLLL